MGRTWGVVAVVVALLLVGCGGSEDPAAAPGGEGGGVDRGEGAVLTVWSAEVEVATPDGLMVEGVDGLQVRAGDVVSTDEVGRAELAWGSEAVVRLAPLTVFEVVGLVGSPAEREVSGRLEVGRTWHRVGRLSGSASYEVVTPVGVAAVRGTVFGVSCSVVPECAFEVAEGVLEVSPLVGPAVMVGAGERLVVGVDGVLSGPDPFDPDSLDDLSEAQVDLGSHANGRLVFTRAGQVWTVEPDGENPLQLTAGSHATPMWSPDGSMIAYVGQASAGSAPLQVMTADGVDGGTLMDLGFDVHEPHPRWSPDGSALVGIGSDLNLHVVSAAGGTTRSLEVALTNLNSPDWSPDGRRIAFMGAADGQTPALFVINADGTGLRQVTDSRTDLAGGIFDGWGVRWSPDGARIAYASRGNGCTAGIGVVDADRQGVQNLDDQGDDDDGHLHSFNVGEMACDVSVPAWSPTSDHVAYWADEFGTYLLDIAPIDGSGSRVLLLGTSSADGPPSSLDGVAFSPDGTQLAFALAAPLAMSDQVLDAGVWTVALADGSRVSVLLGSEARGVDWAPLQVGRVIAGG